MNWMFKLERKYGKYAIHNLVKYLAILNAATFVVLFILGPEAQAAMLNTLALVPSELFKGQIWRLVTFILLPQSMNPLYAALAIYLFYIIGTSLERNWGAFRFNMFYIIGMLGTIVGGIISGLFMPGFPTTATYLNLSLFLAFATMFPDYQLMLFFILPIKVKWLGWLQAAFIGFTVLSSLFAGQWALAIAPVMSLLNYLLFFGKDLYAGIASRYRAHNHRKQYFEKLNQAKYDREMKNKHDDNIRKF